MRGTRIRTRYFLPRLPGQNVLPDMDVCTGLVQLFSNFPLVQLEGQLPSPAPWPSMPQRVPQRLTMSRKRARSRQVCGATQNKLSPPSSFPYEPYSVFTGTNCLTLSPDFCLGHRHRAQKACDTCRLKRQKVSTRAARYQPALLTVELTDWAQLALGFFFR